ncbi:MAG: ABC transporter substrate-binding protein, partial [Candidatus Hodarchaeota archaeon]
MKSKVNARLSRKINGNSLSMNFNKKLILKRISILFFILIFFFSFFISNLNKHISDPYKKDLISYDKDSKLSNQGDKIFKLVSAIRWDLDFLDPHNCWDSNSFNVINQACEGLFTYNLSDPNYAIIPQLALDYGSWNGENYTVTLRTGVMFHDGTPFDAWAVQWNFDRLAYFMNITGMLPPGEWPTIIDSLYRWEDETPIINHTEVINSNTIKFVLNRPYGALEPLLCFPGSNILSPTSTSATEYINITTGDLVGTGPFVYDYRIPGNEIKFHAFENYWAGKANISILKFVIMDWQSQNDALLAGEIDVITEPLSTNFSEFELDPDITLYNTGRTILLNYIGMNNQLINVTFRKAISYAINYSYIISELLGEQYIRLKSPIPGSILFANWSLNVATYNVTKAREIMQSMGFGGGWDTSYPGTNEAEWTGATFATLNFSYNIGNVFREQLLLLLENNLALIGIEIIDAGMTWEDFKDRIYNRRMTSAGWDALQLFPLGWIPDFNDPSNYFEPLFSNRSQYAQSSQYNGNEAAIESGRDPFNLWDNVQLLMDAALLETNQNIRKQYYDRIQQILVEEDYPLAYTHTKQNYDAYRSDILGFQSNDFGKLNFYKVSRNSTKGLPTIHIDGNEEWQYFKDAGKCTGEGTISEPYIIEDLVINGRNNSMSCIRI